MDKTIILQVSEDEAQFILKLLTDRDEILMEDLQNQIEHQQSSRFFQCAACIEEPQ